MWYSFLFLLITKNKQWCYFPGKESKLVQQAIHHFWNKGIVTFLMNINNFNIYFTNYTFMYLKWSKSLTLIFNIDSYQTSNLFASTVP